MSEPTARKHLSTFVEAGRAEAVPADQGVRYKRSAGSVAMRGIASIHPEYSKRELTDAIRRLRDRIAALRDEHGATSPDDLAYELDAGDEGWQAVARWRALEENLDVAKAALSLYDFDPDAGRDSRTDDDSTDDAEGALAGNGPGARV